MAVTTDIVASYRRPATVMRRLLAMGRREDRALAFLMGGCLLTFIAQWPRLAREAHVTGEELNALLGAALLAWIFIMPLVLYALGAVIHLVAKAVGARGSFYSARLALFWSWLAAAPLLLLVGLMAGFAGPGPGLTIVSAAWLAVFSWIWVRSTWAAELPHDEGLHA